MTLVSNDVGQTLETLLELSGEEKRPPDALVTGTTQLPPERFVAQESFDPVGCGLDVVGVDEVAVLAVDELDRDATSRRAHDRRSLPQRL